ncbi:MAG TPA: class I tRNA ligase family protein, partial [Phycisphaerales bacterium]|nr:class I tRNA ligase family protein [Phycisphaerales bacterium]
DVIAQYGADTFRLYEMYMGPLAASKPWNPRDIEGLSRFLARIWRVAVDEQTGKIRTAETPNADVERALHRVIAKVGADIESLSMNTAIAALIEFTNLATKAGSLTADQLGRLTVVLSPFAPHIAEEIWLKLGHTKSLAYEPWPTVDPAMLRDSTVELPVQINGKVKGKLSVPADADAKAIEAMCMADQKVQQAIEGKAVKKVVIVPGKIINIVVG